ncbi:MAG TPA: ribosome maturation factor RimM [Xanthomonadales bacterium]|nr:ribosome maturation factor RimM [Xanthomonadales bacterium]
MGRDERRRGTPLNLGQIAGAHGVKGWVRVHSLTEPREAILEYDSWLLGENQQSVEVLAGSRNGKAIVAQLEGVTDRDQAEAMKGLGIGIDKSQLPKAGEDQYYWTDLIGLEVLLEDGRSLGKIEKMMATGANDVMVVEGDRQRLIPFITGHTVLKVDLESERINVDWDPEF